MQRQNQSNVSVSWQPPSSSRSPPLWFIVEWVCTAPYSKEERFFWKKVPYQDTLTYIQGKQFHWLQLIEVSQSPNLTGIEPLPTASGAGGCEEPGEQEGAEQ